jgi:hypothetical protein
MSATRPKIRRKLARAREKALAGHVEADVGMSRSLVRVGKITVNPETKYS